MKSISFVLFTIALTGCFDVFTPTKKIPGPYYLSKSGTGSYWELYYDLDGAGHGRIDSINKIGWTDRYIFAEKNNDYYFLDKTKDEGLLNADEIVVGPLSTNQFIRMSDSLKINDFTFQLYFDR